MNKITCTALVAIAAALAGCSDPVPAVPDPVPKQIAAGGETLTQQQFVEKYCAEQTNNETCVKVRRAMVAGATRSDSGAKRF
jgi:hypothetical protein